MGKLKNNHGFTLVEILAVLIILGVLIGIVAPRIITFDKGVSDRKAAYETAAETRKDVYNQYLGIEPEETEDDISGE